MILEGSDLTLDWMRSPIKIEDVAEDEPSGAPDNRGTKTPDNRWTKQINCRNVSTVVINCIKKKTECPAYGKQCHKCSKYNYSAKLCKSAKSVHEVTSEQLDYDSDCDDYEDNTD